MLKLGNLVSEALCPASWAMTVILTVGCMLLGPAAGAAVEDSECLFCHGDVNFNLKLPDGSVKRLYVDEQVFKASIHGKEGCTSCHDDATEAEHKPGLKKVNCSGCHEEGEAYDKTPHGKLLKSGSNEVSGCSDCHGMHELPRFPRSSVFRRSRVKGLPQEHLGDLRDVPPAGIGAILEEHSRSGAPGGDQGCADLRGLPRRT